MRCCIRPTSIQNGDMELEAESTAYVILNHFGFDSASYSLGYVSVYQAAAGKDLEGTIQQLRASAQAIHQASLKIIDWLEVRSVERQAA